MDVHLAAGTAKRVMKLGFRGGYCQISHVEDEFKIELFFSLSILLLISIFLWTSDDLFMAEEGFQGLIRIVTLKGQSHNFKLNKKDENKHSIYANTISSFQNRHLQGAIVI